MFVSKIRVSRFKSIYDTLEIDFNEVNGFWRINGPVGSGKTTIGEAIIYGLFGDIRGKNNRDLISWGEKNSTIEVWCTSKSHELYISREINMYGQSPIYVEVDGEKLIFTNKRDAQQQLEEEYYDVSRITLELLCIISFNNFKSLATLNTFDSKQFLDQVFGFYVLTNYVNACKNEKSLIKDNLTQVSSSINAINSQIDKIKQLSTISKIQGNLDEIDKHITQLNESLKSEENKLTKIENEYNSKILELNNSLAEIKMLGTNKAKEIKFIEQGKCPTCGAPIDQSQLDIKKKEKDVLSKQYSSINEQIVFKRKEQQEDTNLLKTNISNIRRDILDETRLRTQLIEQEKRLKINTGEIDTLEQQLKIQTEILNNLYKDEQEWTMLTDILSSDIRHKILSSFIPLLNNSIREYTIQFQLPYIIEFDENFKCTIGLFDVEQNIPVSSLSTGQLKVVDISIILGVLKVITNNSNFNICLLDELLSNMDMELRQVICKVLKDNVKEKQTLFIISHTEFEDKNFDGVIEAQLQYMDNIHRKSIYEIRRLETVI